MIPQPTAYQPLSACRSCAHPSLEPILDLGSTPLANALLAADATGAELHVPLRLVLCPICSLLQIDQTVDPVLLFGTYVYRSSFSDAFLRHAEDLATRMITERKLTPQHLVAEVASNDGYLLQYYRRAGIPVLGIEPASNISAIAVAERGVPTINEFFSRALAERLAGSGTRAAVVHANNVLAHVPDLNGVVAGMATLVAPEGVVVCESPYAQDFIAHCEFDTIYHEHLCYYSLTALVRLFQRHGLEIIAAERIAVHGGSLRITATPKRPGLIHSPTVATLLTEEAAWGVGRASAYASFAAQALRIRADLRALIQRLHQQGKRIAAYGAAAKGATLLTYAGIGADEIEFVADRSTLKRGKLMPGSRLPIVAPEEILARQPDYLLILAWNFAEEIMHQQEAYRKAGGRFIVPIPTVQEI